MKISPLAVVFLAIGIAYGDGQEDFPALIRSAAETGGPTYIKRRDAIVALGETALPWLAEMADDEAASWQKRLTARICFERIARADDIRAMREHDWRQDTPFLPRPPDATEWSELKVETDIGETITYAKPTKPIAIDSGGSPLWQHIDMDKHVVPRMRKSGLWYHFLESYWKNPPSGTADATILFERWWNSDVSRAVVEDEPEGVYSVRILIDKLEGGDSFANRNHRYDYKFLLDRKIADAVPVLVQRYSDYFKHEATGMELYHGARNETFINMFRPFLFFADVRHADLIEEYIRQHPVLAPLRDRVAEVRARPAASPLKDPPFRLGTEPVDKVLDRIASAWEPAFRQDVPVGFVPTPANAILDLRTPERLVWRVDGPLQKGLTRESRFFVQTREAARPDAWCSVMARQQGVHAVGLGKGALLVAHRAYGQNDSKPMPFGEQAALSVHGLEHFTADDVDKSAQPTVFLGDTYGDSTVTDIAFEYPTKGEIQKLLHGKAREDSYRISFRVQATVDGSAERKIAQGEVHGNIGELRRFLLDRDVDEFFAHRHPVRNLGRSGVTYWNGSAWKTADWRPPAPPKPHPIPADLELDIQL